MHQISALIPGSMQGEKQEPNATFKPNLVNTVCFLVQFIIQLMTFAVNYQVCYQSHSFLNALNLPGELDIVLPRLINAAPCCRFLHGTPWPRQWPPVVTTRACSLTRNALSS